MNQMIDKNPTLACK